LRFRDNWLKALILVCLSRARSFVLPGRFAFRRRHRRPLARIRITRSISHRTGAAYHDFFDLEEPYQKLGISNAINKACIDYYRKLGLSRVDLEATLDRGGYTWARYGFLPTQESWGALRLVLRVKLDDPTLNIAADDQQAMLNLFRKSRPAHHLGHRGLSGARGP
jgi:hypothetical protein